MSCNPANVVSYFTTVHHYRLACYLQLAHAVTAEIELHIKGLVVIFSHIVKLSVQS